MVKKSLGGGEGGVYGSKNKFRAGVGGEGGWGGEELIMLSQGHWEPSDKSSPDCANIPTDIQISWQTDMATLWRNQPSVADIEKKNSWWMKIFSKHWPSRLMLSISRNVRLSVCPSVCVFTFEVPFKCLFAPTSQSRMFNIFRDSESLEKSNEKKWSQIWTFLFESCLKLPRKKKFFLFADFALQTWWKPRFQMD